MFQEHGVLVFESCQDASEDRVNVRALIPSLGPDPGLTLLSV